MIKVIHKKDTDKYENVIYVGRGSVLGNPYTSIQGRETLAKFVVDSRQESIQCYKEYLLKCIEEKEEKICSMMNNIYLLSLKGDVCLACYCSPRSCHGDIIKEIIDSKLTKEIKIENRQENNQLNLF